jgi:hypothetical protein
MHLAGEMRSDDIVGQRQVGPLRALPPAAGDGRRPPRPARACVLPPGRVHIPPGCEQRTEEPDLVPRGRRRRDRTRPFEKQPGLGRVRRTGLLRRHLQQPEQPHILRPQASQLPLKLRSSVGRLHTDTISRCRLGIRRPCPLTLEGQQVLRNRIGLGRPPQLAPGRFPVGAATATITEDLPQMLTTLPPEDQLDRRAAR